MQLQITGCFRTVPNLDTPPAKARPSKEVELLHETGHAIHLAALATRLKLAPALVESLHAQAAKL